MSPIEDAEEQRRWQDEDTEEEKMEIEIVAGDSGRWVAREITGRKANGRPTLGRSWTGHSRRHWRRGDIEAAVRAAIQHESASFSEISHAPKGGARWEMAL